MPDEVAEVMIFFVLHHLDSELLGVVGGEFERFSLHGERFELFPIVESDVTNELLVGAGDGVRHGNSLQKLFLFKLVQDVHSNIIPLRPFRQ